jgi:hypothetical protein
VSLTLANVCDGSFNDFNFKVSGYDSQKFKFTYDVSLAGLDCVFRITKPIQGTIYLDVPVTDITVATSNITWTISRTNIPPPGNYYGELLSYDAGTTNVYRSLAQGKLPVTWSLYLNETNYFQRSTTNAAVGQVYIHPSWVYPPWTSSTNLETLWISASNKVVYTNDSRLTDARVPLAHNQGYITITDAPWISGYTETDSIATNLITAHTTNTIIHVLASDKTNWNGKATLADVAAAGYVTNAASGDSNAVWGNISGTLADQLDLTSTVAKAASALQSESDPIWSGISNTVVYTNDSRLTDARVPLAHNQGYTTITDAPWISGYTETDSIATNLIYITSNAYVAADTAVRSELTNTITAHITNIPPHVSASDRTNWNGKATLADVAAAGYVTNAASGDSNAVWGNISGTLADQLDLTSTVAKAAGAYPANDPSNFQGQITAHATNTANPHATTAAQVGAVPTNDISVTNARPWNSPNYNTITNPPAIPSTNGLASTNWVIAQGYTTNAGAGSGSGFPLTNNVNLDGFTMSNGTFSGEHSGNGAGLTNAPYGDVYLGSNNTFGSSFTQRIQNASVDTLEIETAGDRGAMQRYIKRTGDALGIYQFGPVGMFFTIGTNSSWYYFKQNSFECNAPASLYGGLGANVNGHGFSISNGSFIGNGAGLTNLPVTNYNDAAILAATNAINAVANAALPKAGGTMTGALTNNVAIWLPANGIVYFGTATNYIKDQAGTNFIFVVGTNSANFAW